MKGDHEVEFIDLTRDSSGLETATSLSESFVVSNFGDENTQVLVSPLLQAI